MNTFEQKIERKRERYAQLASSIKRKAESANEMARKMAEVIPFGQPILVGHHSERSDRNYRKKIENKFRSSFELEEKAKYYEKKAQTYGSSGISSDDNDAINKLKDKLKTLEDSHAYMIEQNKLYRNGGIGAIDDTSKQLLLDNMKFDYRDKPYQTYALCNNKQNIAGVKRRIEDLEKKSTLNIPDFIVNDIKVVFNKEQNRVQILFKGKPKEEIRKKLKSYGFRWSPTNSAWQRHATELAFRIAKDLVSDIEG